MLNIALIDLNHMTVGVHTNTVPLGLGAIAYYLKKNVSNEFDIRIFKNHTKFLYALERWKPDVLGITQYIWNSELNLYMAQLVKKRNPNCVIIAGGPNLYVSSEEKNDYLRGNSFIDLCVNYDGEIPFAEIIKRLLSGEKIEHIRKFPGAGTYSLDPASNKLAESKAPDPRLDSLDVFNSMYAERFFNELLDEEFHPFLQTQRGCPYSCTYCHTGHGYCSRIIFQSSEYFRKDMEYLGKRFAGQHDVILHLANTNFGLFKEDMDIAQIIREMQDKYDWPKNIGVNTTSDSNKLFKLLSILKYKFSPAIALQTLTPKVLKNIKRKNILFEKFVIFQKNATKDINERTATELILNLPGETKSSFSDVITKVLDSGVQDVIIYTLMALRGTPIASRQVAEQYGHIIKCRLVPRCFSQINGTKIFETEQVVVGTKTIRFKDYIYFRELALVITVFANSIELFPIRKFLMEHRLSIASWIYGMQKRIQYFPNLHSASKSFLEETKKELFTSPQELVNFYGRQENYDLLREGKRGDNLLRKYKTIILSEHYRECLELAFIQIREMAKEKVSPEEIESSIDDLATYLNKRDIGHVFKKGYIKKDSEKVTLRHDVVKWISQEDTPLTNFKGRFSYSVIVTEYMHNRLRDFVRMNQDPGLSKQTLYRDGFIKDFWPLWMRKDNNKKGGCSA